MKVIMEIGVSESSPWTSHSKCLLEVYPEVNEMRPQTKWRKGTKL